MDWLVGSLVLEEGLKNGKDKEEVNKFDIDISGLGSLATMTLGLQSVQRTQNKVEWAWSRGIVAVILRLFIVLLMITLWKEV